MLVRYKGIARVFTLADGGDVQSGRETHGHVLHGMYREVDTAREQPLFKFLNEQPLATDLGERGVEQAVALGGHGHEFDFESGMQALQAIAHVFRLPQGERAFAGTKTQTVHGG